MLYDITCFFNDVHTSERHMPGETKEFTDERAAEIQAAGYYITPHVAVIPVAPAPDAGEE